MANCNNCGKKIKYNKFKRWRNKILCYECYKIRKTLIKPKTEEADIKDLITNPADVTEFFGGNISSDNEE